MFVQAAVMATGREQLKEELRGAAKTIKDTQALPGITSAA